MREGVEEISLANILAAQAEPVADDADYEPWPTITAEAIALISIHDCDEQLASVGENPLRLAQAAKSAHLALQAALTAALAGSMGIGAYDEKLERRWLAALQDGAQLPSSRRIMDFDQLLAKARAKPLEWTRQSLHVTDSEAADLIKLTRIRHGIEHPKPGFWVIEPEYIHNIIPVAVRIALELLHSVYHHFEEGELEGAAAAASRIAACCSTDDAPP